MALAPYTDTLRNVYPPIEKIDAFRLAVLALYRSIPDDGSNAAAHVAAVVAAIDISLPRCENHAVADRPVTRYLPACLNREDLAFPALAGSLKAIADGVQWKANPDYRDIPPPVFLDNQAFAEVIGPDGVLVTPDVRICLFMMGRDLHYPLHSHETTELYHVVSGNAYWRKGDEGWALLSPGSAIFHDVSEAHEIRTGGEPLLAISTRIGNLAAGKAKLIVS